MMRDETLFAEPFGPIGHDDPMRGPADGVLGQAEFRREDADDEVGLAAGRRGDQRIAFEGSDATVVGRV